MKILAFVIAGLMMTIAGLAQAEEGRISVTGQGSSVAVPDMARVSIGVRHTAQAAQDAMDQTSAAMQQVTERLLAMNIEARDIQTQNVSVSPVWDRVVDQQSGQNRREMVGFAASNTVSIRVRDLDGLGAVLGAVLEEGGNEMNGLSFSASEPKPLLAQARSEAVRDAREKAEQLAAAAGVSLGRVISIDEHGGVQPVMARAAFAAEARDVPVQAGEVGYDVSVSMVFAIAE